MRTPTLHTLAIMKTDIKGSTARFRALAGADLDALLTEHHNFVSRIAAVHHRRIVKREGDGTLRAFRSYLYSRDLDAVVQIEAATHRLPQVTSIFVTGQVRQDLLDTPWETRLGPVNIEPVSPQFGAIEVYRLGDLRDGGGSRK